MKLITNFIEKLTTRIKQLENNAFEYKVEGNVTAVVNCNIKAGELSMAKDRIVELGSDLESFLETYFHVVQFITDADSKEIESDYVYQTRCSQGINGLFNLAKYWTEEFETQYADVEWGVELEYFDTLEEFLIEKNKL